MSAKHTANNVFSKLLDMPVYVNILAVVALLCLIAYIVLKCLDIYTNHNQAVVVPDVKGLQIEDAEPFFRKNSLKYVLVDSTFSKDAKPGAIVELTPEANSRVKRNRTVYVTVNAKTEKKIAVPDVTDISYREAFALLHSRGFADIERKYVAGAYLDLAIGVEYGGKMVKSGTKVPVSAKLILVIGDGSTSIYTDDSTNVSVTKENAEGDSWF